MIYHKFIHTKLFRLSNSTYSLNIITTPLHRGCNSELELLDCIKKYRKYSYFYMKRIMIHGQI